VERERLSVSGYDALKDNGLAHAVEPRRKLFFKFGRIHKPNLLHPITLRCREHLCDNVILHASVRRRCISGWDAFWASSCR
jgi:hypothetical protein